MMFIICLCQINKPFDFLQYEFVNYGNELDHLRKLKAPVKSEHMDDVVNLRLQGLTLREIADKLGITLGKVDWLLKAANKKG
ncbi:hypothetical protein [Mucilaginibacter sp.]|uniref:hypothetical protein n=1 Tax=Mucilaginibacter sp. TaxID=1882438 RepID=UPI002604DFA8|nr:hypothetical protein [Mucilaginibacter sp.]MDB4918187.1 hypothetical protein [Mucilaginibacter sp.]